MEEVYTEMQLCKTYTSLENIKNSFTSFGKLVNPLNADLKFCYDIQIYSKSISEYARLSAGKNQCKILNDSSITQGQCIHGGELDGHLWHW